MLKQKVKRGRFAIRAGEGKDAPSAKCAKKVQPLLSAGKMKCAGKGS